jgi:hypothetical protein
VPDGRGVSFDALLQRIHPAESRVRLLAKTTPAIYIAFDLLGAEDGESLLSTQLEVRRGERRGISWMVAPCASPPQRVAGRKQKNGWREQARPSMASSREATGLCLPFWGTGRDAKNQKLSQRRLCGRRISLRNEYKSRGLATAGAIRRRRLAPPCGIHFQYSGCGSAGLHKKTGIPNRKAPIHGVGVAAGMGESKKRGSL